MATAKARFLGYDSEGVAVFQDVGYSSATPTTEIAGTSFPQLDSPDVFRLSRDEAAQSYGKEFEIVEDIHPALSRRTPFSEQELAEHAAEFDRIFGLKAPVTVRDLERLRGDAIQSTKEFLIRAGDRAAEGREEQQKQQQIIRESAAFHGGWVPGNPSEEERLQLREDYKRRQEWNELIKKDSVDGQQQRPLAEMTRQEIVNEARTVRAQLLHLNGSLENSQGDERIRMLEGMKPLAKRENELCDEYLSRRKREALTDNPPEQSIRMLRAFAKDRAQADYVVPEVAIATNLADQLQAGAKRIDLSQRYWTNNPAEAEERHRRALEYLERHLGPALRHAEKQAEHLDYGKAIAHGNKQSEVLAVSNGHLKRGLANTAGLLQSAATHSHHVVEAPRLSIGEGAGGGL